MLGLSVCEWQPLTPTMMVIRGLTFNPAVLSVWTSGLHSLYFSPMLELENQLRQYVKCLVFDGVGISDVWLSLGAPSTHRMPGLSLSMHVHGVREHVHCSSCSRTVISWVLVSSVDKSVRFCTFVWLKCVCYLFNKVLMVGYAKSFYVLVRACG